MGIDADQVCAVVVTRGDVDLDPVLDSLDLLADTFVWNNSREPDLGVYGRYAMLERHGTFAYPAVYVQDDDCVLPPASIQALLDSYEPGVLVANLPAKFHERYKARGTCMVGFGAIFDRDLPERAFAQFASAGVIAKSRIDDGPPGRFWYLYTGRDDLGNARVNDQFLRTCDLVFAGLTPHKTLDLPYEDLPWARDESRMWRQPGHFEERLEMINLVRAVRDGVTA